MAILSTAVDPYQACIYACSRCAQACYECLNACLNEQDANPRKKLYKNSYGMCKNVRNVSRTYGNEWSICKGSL